MVADGNITLDDGTVAGSRIGHQTGLVGSGNISVTSNGGSIALNATHGVGTAIRTTGTVTLGAAAAGPAIVTILVDLIVTTSLCIALSRLDGADEHGARKAARNALKGVLTNPMPWAIVMGAVASGLGFRLIEPIEKTVALLADSASPVALFTIGAVLARSQISAKETQHTPILWRDVLPTVFFKLVLHPVLVLLVLSAAIQQGFHVERFTLVVVVLVAALPSASNVAVLTERFGANTGRIAKIILLSTATAFFTFSGAVALLVDS